MTGKIAVIRAGALGDVILTLPALRALRARFPDAAIRVAGYPELWEIAGPLVYDITSIDAALFAGLFSGRDSPGLRAWLRDVDLVAAWTARDPTASLRAAGVGAILHASPYPPPGVHAADWLLSTIPMAPAGPATPRLDLDAGEVEAARVLLDELELERPTLIHPGAGARWKRWPAERFARVAEALRREAHEVVLIEGPADAEATAEVQAHTPIPLAVLRNLPLRLLAAVLARSHLFLGNDSGVTHLAAAAGVPVLALFGPTDPASWAPRGHVHILRACTATAAHQGQIRVCEDPTCLQQITVQDVLASIELSAP